MEKPILLAVDDHEHILRQLKWALSEDFEVHTALSKAEALAALQRVQPGLLTVDLALGPGDLQRREGFEILQAALRANPGIKAVVITSDQEKMTATQAVRMGACDYFVKPLPLEELRAALKRAAYLSGLERASIPASDFSESTGIIGESTAMVELQQIVRRVAETDFTVLVLGESGVGKELVAAAVAKLSPRRNRPYVVVNCAAIPETLLESELFGHEKGAFTGAYAQKKGKFEAAGGGTLFLDEISDLSQGLQAKLLRFLQERTIERVGGMHPIQLDVRVIAATNRDLESDVRAKLFREDLYYRLKVLPVQVPRLRERDEDVLLLADYFLERLARAMGTPRKRLAPDAQTAVQRYEWPGNVRELENVINAAAVTTSGPLISARTLGLQVSDTEPRDLRAARDELERALVTRALQRNDGVISRAARDLAVSRVTFYDLMDKHGLRSLRQAD
jgi:two-component system NtrC family response regulator